MKSKYIKYILVFILGFFTPILALIILGIMVYVNHSSTVDTVSNIITEQVEVLKEKDYITYLNIYNGAIVASDELVIKYTTSYEEFTTLYNQKIEPYLEFRTDRINAKIDFINSIKPLIGTLENVDYSDVSLTNKERTTEITAKINNINLLIDKLKSSDINFDEEIMKLQDMKASLLELQISLSLTNVEKTDVANTIITQIKNSDSNIATNMDFINTVFTGEKIEVAMANAEEKLQILLAENNRLTDKISTLEGQLNNAKTEIENLKITISEKEKQIDHLETNEIKLRNELDVLLKELKNSNEINQDQTATIATNDQKILELNEQINTINEELGDRDDEIEKLNEEIQEYQRTIFEYFIKTNTNIGLLWAYNSKFGDSSIKSLVLSNYENNEYKDIKIYTNNRLTAEQQVFLAKHIKFNAYKYLDQDKIDIIFMNENTSITIDLTQ